MIQVHTMRSKWPVPPIPKASRYARRLYERALFFGANLDPFDTAVLTALLTGR